MKHSHHRRKGAPSRAYRALITVLLLSLIASSAVFGASDNPLQPPIRTQLRFSDDAITLDHTNALAQYYIISIYDSAGNEVVEDVVAQKVKRFARSYQLPSDGDYRMVLYASADRYATYHSIWDTELVAANSEVSYRVFDDVLAINRRYNSNHYDYQIKHLDNVNAEIAAKSQALTAGVDSVYQKVLILHDWITENIYYDYDELAKAHPDQAIYDGVATFKNKKGVCDGMARLFYLMLQASNIPVKYVHGYTYDMQEITDYQQLNNRDEDSNHAWNDVYIVELGKWVTIDVTWDTNNAYKGGKWIKQAGDYEYFDPDMTYFSQSHLISEALVFNEVNFYQSRITLYIGYPYYFANATRKPIDNRGSTPVIISGHTMLPLRAIIEEMGGTVSWHAASQTIHCNVKDYDVVLQIGNKNFTVTRAGQTQTLSFNDAPIVKDGRTLIPVRALFEAIDCHITWLPKADGWNGGRVEIWY